MDERNLSFFTCYKIYLLIFIVHNGKEFLHDNVILFDTHYTMSLSDTEVADTSENTQDVDYFVDEYDDNSEEYANIDLELENISNVLEDADRVNTEIQEKAENTKSDAKEALAEQEKNEQERNERDARSVFVRNVHWDATAEEIALFFAPCGPVESCKILMDHNHRPKGYVLNCKDVLSTVYITPYIAFNLQPRICGIL